jgi:hypothetical protein
MVRFLLPKVMDDLTFLVSSTISVITQKGITQLSKSSRKTDLKDITFCLRFIELKNLLSNTPSKKQGHM